MTTQITQTDIPNVLEELETAFYDIPFENSNFQNSVFVVASQQTPGRAYRAIGLRMFAKIRAVKELGFSRRLEEIELMEKQETLDNPLTGRFEKMRTQVEIDKIHDQRKWTDKLLNDALQELGCLYGEFKKLPRYNREQFEEEERTHFQLKLERAAQGQLGALESLANMHNDVHQLELMAQNPEILSNMVKKIDKLIANADTSAV